jgi:hypothetical protein
VRFGPTTLHCPLRPVDLPLASLLALGLYEDREQDDPPAQTDPIGDPRWPTLQVEAQLPELAVQLTGVGFVQGGTELGETVDMESHQVGIGVIEGQEPVTNLRFEFDMASHSVHAISVARPSETDRTAPGHTQQATPRSCTQNASSPRSSRHADNDGSALGVARGVNADAIVDRDGAWSEQRL